MKTFNVATRKGAYVTFFTLRADSFADAAANADRIARENLSEVQSVIEVSKGGVA